MAIITGATAPGIWKGREDLGIHLRADSTGVFVGSDDPGVFVGQRPRAVVLDGITSHITIDDLAADGYAQTDLAHGYVMLIKAADPSKFSWYAALGDNTNAQNNYVGVIASTGAAGVEGRLRSAVSDTASATASFIAGDATTAHVDDIWHIVHCADHLNGANGDLFGQVDGAARTLITSYPRYAVPSGGYDWMSIGVRRFQSPPLIQAHAPMTLGYLARYDGEPLNQDSWDAIASPFLANGDKFRTEQITEAIQKQLITGRIKWAGDLDGSAPHVNPDSAAAPVYVDCTFVPANY